MSKNKSLDEDTLKKVAGSLGDNCLPPKVLSNITPDLIQGLPKDLCCGQGICIPHI